LQWFWSGPDAAQRAKVFKFDPPDNLWQATWRCRDSRYLKEYFRWLRFGPDEARDAKQFEEQWAKAGAGGELAVAKSYLDQRTRRQTSLTHHKSDVLTFYTILTAVVVFLAAIAPEGVRNLISPSLRPVAGLLVIALVMALASYTNKLLYPLYTHFMGAAEYGHEVVHEKSYINKVRQEVNSLSRTLQRGKRLFSASKLCVYGAVVIWILINHYR
jgi:hypothetical protein